jgi:transglutaminase-like putative cysteine protease
MNKTLEKLSCSAVACAMGFCCMATVTEAEVTVTSGTAPKGTQVYTPTSPETTTYVAEGAVLDASNIREGYVTVRYNGGVAAKVTITKNGGTTYTYDLFGNDQYVVYPLSEGSGTYNVSVYYNLYDNQFALAIDQNLNVNLRDEVSPFLYPNQYVNFSASSPSARQSATLAAGATSQLQIVDNIYNYVVNNIRYDEAKANQITSGQLPGYIPNPDATLSSGSGVCCDYAARMCAMLRTQQIPARMEYGIVTGGTFHAWVSVYLPDQGWVNNAIQFDGSGWTRLDPTFAAGAGAQYAGDGCYYQTQFCY